MGTRAPKKKNPQLSFFFDPSRRTPRQMSAPSTSASTANQAHSPHVAPIGLTLDVHLDPTWCAFCQDHHFAPCPYIDPTPAPPADERADDRVIPLNRDRRR